MTMEKLCSGQRKNTLRQVLAYLLWLMPLFSCPLVWLRPVYGKLPLWGDVLFISSHVTGIIAAAIILLPNILAECGFFSVTNRDAMTIS